MRSALIGTCVTTLLILGIARPLAAQTPDGRAIYSQECRSCHGVNGVPPARARDQYRRIRTLGDSGFVARLAVDSIVTILKNGIDKDMKSFADKLSDADMRAVAAYIKELAARRRPG